MRKHDETGKFVQLSDKPLQKVAVRLDPDDIIALDEIAKELNVARSDILRKGLKMVLAEYRQSN